MAALRQKLCQGLQQEQRRARKMREQDLNPKPPDDTTRSTWRSPHKTSHAPKSVFCFYFQPTNEL
ncbi:hypothetical protein ABTD45_19545, partial [Acinetobacter baumannii]